MHQRKRAPCGLSIKLDLRALASSHASAGFFEKFRLSGSKNSDTQITQKVPRTQPASSLLDGVFANSISAVS